MLRVLSERQENVDVLAYPEGTDIKYEHITLYRANKIPFVTNVQPGFSWKKIAYDFVLFLKAIQLVLRQKYHLIHAVEETVFIALLLKTIFRIPYIYNMDSSLAQQMVEKYSFLSPLKRIFECFEEIAVKNAEVAIPVCPALASDIAKYKPKKVMVLPDISLLRFPS
ncbi:MAG: glycosyltransferase [Richelia sp.]|nr:glycosyltransferase [Richelia sp.]